jgi:hypothetical protein
MRFVFTAMERFYDKITSGGRKMKDIESNCHRQLLKLLHLIGAERAQSVKQLGYWLDDR